MARKIARRTVHSSTEIYLPKVLVVEEGLARDFDYETDVLSAIDWRGFDPAGIAASIPDNAQAAESQLQRIRLSDSGEELLVGEAVAANPEAMAFDPVYAVRMVSDIVLNPFVGREIVGRLMAGLTARGFDDGRIGQTGGLILEELRRGLDAERSRRAEALFKTEVAAGRIQFRLRVDGRNWRMPFSIETTEPQGSRQLVGKTGGPVEKSLFAPVYEAELNSEEREVAVYLDGETALTWWHRNVARMQYGLQGWKKAKVYPDFIFAVQRQGEARRIAVLETKGDQLDNLDSGYKRELMRFLSDSFRWDDFLPAGQLELVQNGGETVKCELMLMSEWKAKLPAYF